MPTLRFHNILLILVVAYSSCSVVACSSCSVVASFWSFLCSSTTRHDLTSTSSLRMFLQSRIHHIWLSHHHDTAPSAPFSNGSEELIVRLSLRENIDIASSFLTWSKKYCIIFSYHDTTRNNRWALFYRNLHEQRSACQNSIISLIQKQTKGTQATPPLVQTIQGAHCNTIQWRACRIDCSN